MTDFNPTDRIARDFEQPYPSLLERLTARPLLALTDYAEGLDLSHWRPNTDLPAAKQNGIDFVITKATEGDYFVDDWYQPYHDDCKLLNLPFTGFHYWKADTPAIAQAQYYIEHTQDDHEMLDVLDVERYGNEGVLSPDDAAQSIHDTAQETQQKRGKPVMIYTSAYQWQVVTDNSPIIATFPLWVAHWTTAASPTLPVGAVEWVLWQYTNQYKIPGYTTSYDGNRFNGNEQAFQEYLKSLNGGNGCDCDELKAEIAAVKDILVQHTLRLDTTEQKTTNQHKRIKVLEDLRAKMKEIL